MELNLHRIIYIILAIVFCFFGVFLLKTGVIYTGIITIIVPTVTIYSLIFVKEAVKLKKYVILPTLLMFYILVLPFSSLFEAIQPISALWRFSSTIKQFYDSKYTSFFPKTVPNDAQDVKFSFTPQFLQGGGYIVLKTKVPKNKFQEIYNSFVPRKIEGYKEISALLPFSSMKDFSVDSYEIVQLYAESYKPDDWNHGNVSGLAFDRDDTIVVYWYEFW